MSTDAHKDSDLDSDSVIDIFDIPLSPGTRLEPRRRQTGGYFLRYETVWPWAKRVWELDDTETEVYGSAWIWANNDIKERSGGLKLTALSEDAYEVCMFITQSERFDGWKGMSESEIPKFIPHEEDERVKQFLIEEGSV